MKTQLSLFTLFLVLFTTNVLSEKLITPSYIINVNNQCDEGSVTCQKIAFTVKERSTQESSNYMGHSKHSLCADGITPCHLQAYVFNDGKNDFFLYPDGRFSMINENSKVILHERGKWNQ